MRPLKTLSLLSIPPVLQCSACRNVPLYPLQDLRWQCSIANSPTSNSTQSTKRSSTASTAPSSRSSSSTNSGFSYRIGAAFSGKGRRFSPKQDTYTYDPERQIDSEKHAYTGRPSSGQDAFFVSKCGNSRKMAWGVADGVGGWSDQGIDSAEFSHGLCRSMAAAAAEGHLDHTGNMPQALLGYAYDEIVRERKIAGGGSTACVAEADEDGTLSVANLGDSGFIHFRLNAAHYFSNPQTHAFNTPFQLSVVPPKILAMNRVFGGKQLSDSPKDANKTDHQVRHGDVLIFATDGVWDNLTTRELLQIVSRQMTGFHAWEKGLRGISVSDRIHNLTKTGGIPLKHEDTLQTQLALSIVGEAKRSSLDTKRDGPFAREVQKFYPQEDYHGGKVDDICVVAVIVVEEKASKSVKM